MLPPGASFSARNGRASADVSMDGGSIVVNASCDSLAVRCYFYERKLSYQQETLEEMQTLIQRKDELLSETREEVERMNVALPWLFGAGVLLGVLAAAGFCIGVSAVRRNRKER